MSTRTHGQGFMLLPVVLILAVIGTIALTLNQKSIVAIKQTASINEFEKARYVADAGLLMAEQELLQDTDCAAYSVASTGRLNNTDYQLSVSPVNGSPVLLTIDVEQEGGTKQYSREVKMHGNTGSSGQTINSSQEVYIRSTDTTTNYSGEDTLHVKHKNLFGTFNIVDRIAILQFDLSSVSVDVNKIIAVSLELHLSGAPDSSNSSVDVHVHRVKNDWLENETTYSERVSGVAWQISDVDLSPIAMTTVDEGVIGWVNWDVKDLVVGWLDGTYVNYGLELWGDSGVTNNLEFISKNHADNTKHPILRITTSCECGQTCS